MEVYFFIGLFLILINVVFIILTLSLKRNDFFVDKTTEKQFPYGFKLLGIIISLIVFAFCFVIEYLSSHCLPFLIFPVVISYPLYYYFIFICNVTKPENLHKKEFFPVMFGLVSAFYLLFLPLANDVSLNYQINLIISTQIPLLELVIIFYIHLALFVLLLNIVLYYDAYNYIIKKQEISSQQFRKQHSALCIISFIVSGFITSIVLNGQFLTYPDNFNFDKFQNIILIYQIFLSSATIMLSFKNSKARKA